MAALGSNLFSALSQLETLLEQTSDGPDHDKLQSQYDQLWNQAQSFVDANVQAATTEYTAAISELSDANKTIQSAISGLAKAIDVINAVAKVISALATLAAKVGAV